MIYILEGLVICLHQVQVAEKYAVLASKGEALLGDVHQLR